MTPPPAHAVVSAPANSLARRAPSPPFRADHVGSLLRPLALERARALVAKRAIGAAELQAVEDAAIAEAVALQQSLGFKGVTDGELRRAYFHLDFLAQIEGIESYVDPHASAHFRKTDGEVFDFSPPRLRVTRKLRRRAPIMGRDFRFIDSQVVGDGVAKLTIPSPTMALRAGRAGVDPDVYPDLEDFTADLTAVYREEVADLTVAGCRYLQLDDTNLAYLCDHHHCDAARARGEDPDHLPEAYAKLINDSLSGVPDDVFTAIHLCKGNFRSAFAAEGGYDPIAEAMFNLIDIDAFLLEYDDERSGSFEPLKYLPKGKYVVLGLISSKSPVLETKDEIKRRIDQAARFAPIEQLCLSPQCGFASTEHGNDISFDDQRRKLELVVECAREVWGQG
ncbi:MAG: 5-methyltetrahydropteroyltriglutamate--homocysteine S-methyltransferase [Caulobacteraceae bacterium]